jgi:hypothetical protein
LRIVSPRDRRSSWIVSIWLLGQLSTWAVVPVALCAQAAGERAVVECTCTHDDGQACPMHHRAPMSKDTCSCTGTDAGITMASLLGPTAVLPASTVAEPSIAIAPFAQRPGVLPVAWAIVPDSPPPRL